MSWFSSLFAWFSSIFFTKSAEIAIVGLQVRRYLWLTVDADHQTVSPQGSGKTSFVNVLEIGGGWTEDVVPTVAFSYVLWPSNRLIALRLLQIPNGCVIITDFASRS
jgi:ADP-ribosylation factor-like protein 8